MRREEEDEEGKEEEEGEVIEKERGGGGGGDRLRRGFQHLETRDGQQEVKRSVNNRQSTGNLYEGGFQGFKFQRQEKKLKLIGFSSQLVSDRTLMCERMDRTNIWIQTFNLEKTKIKETGDGNLRFFVFENHYWRERELEVSLRLAEHDPIARRNFEVYLTIVQLWSLVCRYVYESMEMNLRAGSGSTFSLETL
ncbi:hypothetical protein BY996DRAFT_6454081 [Phakopsora pachyrhizi]|nr:hypothetical protein BY996DRAFT_6454081 [Phakopsora pachyrhizi]